MGPLGRKGRRHAASYKPVRFCIVVAQLWLTPGAIAAPWKQRGQIGVDPEVYPTTTEARFVLLGTMERPTVAPVFAEVPAVWLFSPSGLRDMGVLVVNLVGTVAPSDASHSQPNW
jgi:hypothetical protein